MMRRGGRSARGGRKSAPTVRRQRDVAEALATLRIDSIAAGGDGVGRVDGLACFVPRTAPGDVAQVALKMHARHARGRVLQLLESSPLRVEPTCSHYVADRCGGCQLQHLSADAQRDARLTIVQDALRRIGKRDVPRATLVHGADWAYRGRLTLTLKRRGATWIGGLHPFDDSARVFELNECAISHPSLLAAWHTVRTQLRDLPDALSLRMAFRQLDEGNVALVVSGGTAWVGGAAWGNALLSRDATIVAVWWERDDGERVALSGRATDVADIGLSAFTDDGPDASEALAFAQVNADVAKALRAFVGDQVRKFEPRTVIDAYAGIGVIAELIAADGTQVTAIESDPAGARHAARRLAPWSHVRVVQDVVESSLEGLLPADVVVLNPPRRGVDVQVTAVLADAAQRGVRAIIYVSCDPATLSRDLARLASWRIDAMRCFDMFPQTSHVETVCVLVPEPL